MKSDPTPNMPETPWESLSNSASGRPALILGKGPSLDAWIAADCPHPEQALLIGINDVVATLPNDLHVPWSVSTHRCPEWQHLRTKFVVSYPSVQAAAMTWSEQWLVPDWVAHVFLHVIGGFHAAKALTREQIAKSHILANQSSSAQPALHFAWYLGCSSLTLVGIDGATSDGIHHYGPTRHTSYLSPPTPGTFAYSSMRRDTEQIASTLFGNAWSHWGTP